MADLLQRLISLISSEGSRLVTKAVTNKTRSFTFPALPRDLDSLKALPEATLQDAYGVAALTIAALVRYETDPEACFEMLNWLKGPDPLTPADKIFLRERLQGKEYKPRSFFSGAVPDNNYTPSGPWTMKVHSNPYSFQNENWAVLYLQSGGADNERPVKLRKKPSTGQWFLNDIQCLSDIRLPASEDKWR
ncbi:MAG: hypothetical protein IKX62_05715 [Bacteroidales bacterium]|nr:hypothetical protein [Bacteroidales bacterium]